MTSPKSPSRVFGTPVSQIAGINPNIGRTQGDMVTNGVKPMEFGLNPNTVTTRSADSSGNTVYTLPNNGGSIVQTTPVNNQSTVSYTPVQTQQQNNWSLSDLSSLINTQLDSWWKKNQPTTQNTNTNQSYSDQGLSTLFPRVNWGNYQGTNRGNRYFDQNTGNYNLGNTISMGI